MARSLPCRWLPQLCCRPRRWWLPLQRTSLPAAAAEEEEEEVLVEVEVVQLALHPWLCACALQRASLQLWGC